MSKSINSGRRDVLKNIAALAAGTAIISNEELVLAEQLADDAKNSVTKNNTAKNKTAKNNAAKDVQVDGLSGASRKHTDWGKLADLKKPIAKGTIKGVETSRLVMGGNLVGGWAHSRDLLYVSDLVKAYFTRDKIIATFKMAEACGINTYIGHESHIGILSDYWEKEDGTLHFIADSHSLDGALKCIDKGADGVYFYGELADQCVKEGKYDEIIRFIERVRKEDVPVGIGGHQMATIKGCVEHGIEPDFWMKTIHHHKYWSRMADKPERDNVYCREPEETKELMNSLKQPWIGFKVLAAGAIHPKDGFRYALEAGADFLCVGMYDFQIVNDVNICMDILASDMKRSRPVCFT